MLSHLQTQRGRSKQQHSHPKWEKKAIRWPQCWLTTLSSSISLAERVQSLAAAGSIAGFPESNQWKKTSSRKAAANKLLRLCREHTGPAVKRPGFKAQLCHLERHERNPSLYGNKSHHLLSFVPDTTLNILHTWSNLVLLTTLWGKFLSS